MANWDSYTQKTTPADADTLMIKDTAGGANKRTPFSGVWNWIVGKLTSAVISQLETTNKSIIPAINELNSNISSYNLDPYNAIKITVNSATYSGGCLLFMIRSNPCDIGFFVLSVYRTSSDLLYDLVSLDGASYTVTKSGDSFIISKGKLMLYSEVVCIKGGSASKITITPFSVS